MQEIKLKCLEIVLPFSNSIKELKTNAELLYVWVFTP